MGVALENARLFDETKRLLTETDERAAELAIINSVQEGLAAELDMQAMYDLVGDKIQEIFDAQVVDIGILDLEAGLVRYPYRSSAACASPTSRRRSRTRRSPGSSWRRRQPVLVNDIPDVGTGCGAKRCRSSRVSQRSSVAHSRRSSSAARSRGRISLQNLDRTNAFTEADVRLLSTLAVEPQRRARERAALRRDEAPADRDRRARRRAGDHQQRPGRPRPEPRHAGHVRPRRRQDPGDLRRPGRRTSASTTREPGRCSYPYSIERGVRCRRTDPDRRLGACPPAVLETRQPLSSTTSQWHGSRRAASPQVIQGEAGRCRCSWPR